MRKAMIFIVVLLAGFVSRAQDFYFFCINLGDHTDGTYIANVIDDALNNNKVSDFVIYIRGGVNKDGKVFDAVKITDRSAWDEAKGLLDYIDRCSVLAASEKDMLCRTFQPLYTSENQKFQPLKPITVYWFGDEQYYRDYGRTLFLPFYYAVEAEKTWRTCYLFGDNSQMEVVTANERMGTNRYLTNNLIVK